MLLVRLISIMALGAMLSGCMSDGNGLDASLGNGLATLGGSGGPGSFSQGGGAAAASLPSTDAYVKQQLERRGI